MNEPSEFAFMQKIRYPGHRGGFTLIMSVALLFLIALLAIGMLSMSSIELRRSSQSAAAAVARSNARLALMLAIGNLQKQLGPDQRVSAPASQGGDLPQRHWTGVWSTRAADGKSLWRRDDANGGLIDSRGSDWKRDQKVLNWLVSGNEIARNHLPSGELASGASVILVDKGSLGDKASEGDLVKAPLVRVGSNPGQSGHFAYWVGDEGIKANVATVNAYEGKKPDPNAPGDGGYFALLNSQEADAAAALGGNSIANPARARVVSQRQLELLENVGKDVAGPAFHNITTHSRGVFCNVREGRLKRDLTAFIESKNSFPDLTNAGAVVSPGLKDADNLVGPANTAVAAMEGIDWVGTRHKTTSPRFALIREWAGLSAGIPMKNDAVVASVEPKAEATPKINTSAEVASANYKPASIANYSLSSLAPIICEATTQWTYSYYLNPQVTNGLYQYRRHVYPRVVLWNPYNARIRMKPILVMMQGNGRHETLETYQWGPFTGTGPGVWWNDGRGNDLSFPNGDLVNSATFKEAFVGSNYFSVPETVFEPGECLVFSVAKGMEYDTKNLANNLLSCEVPPDVGRCIAVSNELVNSLGQAVNVNYFPLRYQFSAAVDYVRNQADDQRIVAKMLDGRTSVTFNEFDNLPQFAYVSCSFQYGGGREPRLVQRASSWQNVEKTATLNPKPTILPDVRSREGMRLRWFQEHPSNIANAGPLKNTAFFEEAPLATWNPRAAYATRNPWDNVGGTLPVSGSAGGPWFFGIYTRDLYDQSVSWNDQMPVYRNGRYHGNPFGTPQEGRERIVLFDIPRKGTGVVSMAQMQHAKFSEFVWQPSYAFANSLVDPRLATGPIAGLNRTSPLLTTATEKSRGGFDATNIGWSSDAERSTDNDAWARQGRSIYQDYTNTDNLCFDLSYELNHTLWDDFFLSTGDRYAKENFLANPGQNPLPNGRIRLNPDSRSITASQLTDLHLPARHLLLDGAFNVNSTSPEAWEALLRSTKGLMGKAGAIAFPRVLNPSGSEWSGTLAAANQNAWDGYRVLNDAEVKTFAREIVKQVKLRGPFLSLADFVNRRLRDDETGRMGPLQAAIDSAGLNQAFRSAYPLNNKATLPDYKHPDNLRDATRLEQTLKPDSKAWGLPGYLTQADVLQVIGPVLSARSDTFRIRAYGDALDDKGGIVARAWCEAIVQRSPAPIRADSTGVNPVNPGKAGDFGRRFQVVSFRWMSKEEI
jgi:hypothetical protein